MPKRKNSESTYSLQRQDHPNFLILCMDQWQTHMQLPEEVDFPSMRRLEAQGVSFNRQYCTVPICTPSRASMFTGVHARHTGLWDNTNFAWIEGLDPRVPTIGQMLREQGYYTAFKGKWHLSELPHNEDALEANGFSDYQQWGDMFGAPLQGEQLDGVAVFETVDWLEHKAPRLDQPWLMVCSLINPHDIMYLQTDPIEAPAPNGFLIGKQTTAQRLAWFEKKWNLKLPDNFADDLLLQPFGVRHYKENVDKNYGRLPDDREDLWLARRNYLVNCMRLVDREFGRVLDALDRLNLWRNTVVLFMSDHGEMNGAHRMTQKGAIHFDEAAIVNLTACVPGGPQGKRTAAVGSHLDLAPTLLEFAGMTQEEISTRYPRLKGRSLKSVMLDPEQDGPRGSARSAGDGALFCWDGLNMLDIDWSLTGALQQLTDLPLGEDRQAHMQKVGREHGAPDFKKRTLYRALVNGRYKFVRWFAPDGGYGNPSTLDELYEASDVTLHDLESDPSEMENIGHPDHPRYDATLVNRMLKKLNALIEREIGEDLCPFDLDMFGSREVKYPRSKSQISQTSQRKFGPRNDA